MSVGTARRVLQIATLVCLSVVSASAQPPDCVDLDQIVPNYLHSVPTAGEANEMVIVGDLGYLADGPGGFSVWDVADPENPTRLSTLETQNSITGLWVSGDYAYVAEQYLGALVIDISDSLTPIAVGSVETPRSAIDITGNGTVLAVADWYGLAIIDASTPTEPYLASYVELGTYCRDVAMVGDVVFAGVYDGIYSYDISNPADPALLMRLDGGQQVLGMTVRGERAYLSATYGSSYHNSCEYCSQFSIVDISDPTNMVILGAVNPPGGGAGWDVAVASHYAYVPDYKNGLIVIDLADETNPVVTGYGTVQANSHQSGRGIGLKDDTAIVCNDDGGLDIYDLAGPALSDAISIPGKTRDFVVRDDLAYISTGYYDAHVTDHRVGLQIVDVSDPTHLRALGETAFPEEVRLLAIADSYVYLRASSLSHSLFVADVSDPQVPVQVGHLDAPGAPLAAVVQDGFLVVAADSAGVLIYDLVTPAEPRLVASLPLSYPVSLLAVAGDRIYASSYSHTLTVLDWTIRTGPVVIGSLELEGISGLLAVQGMWAYLHSSQNGPLAIIDVSDPVAMTLVGGLATSGFSDVAPVRMTIRGDIGYLSTLWGGLYVADFSDPAAARITKRLNLPAVWDASLVGNSLYALSWDMDLQLGTLYSVPVDCESTVSSVKPAVPVLPFKLAQNHPNPFNPRTEISFNLRAPQIATLKVHDLRGHLVSTLFDKEMRPAGWQSVAWNGRDNAGRPVGAGVYLYRLEAEGLVATRRMTLLK